MEPHLAPCFLDETIDPPKSSPEHRSTSTDPLHEINLSRYFPEGTQYFYGYPVGEDSHFYNSVPPLSEELVTARSLVCAGPHVSPVVYPPSIDPKILRLLCGELGIVYAEPERVVPLPASITPEIVGSDRNTLLKRALNACTGKGRLAMAQPFLDSAVEDRYQIPPALTVWLNDKRNLASYIPLEYLPRRYAEYANGAAFAASSDTLPIPSVVKVSSSSAGDGVSICKSEQQLSSAKERYSSIVDTIIVEQYITAKRNFGIQIGIPHDKSRAVEIVGVSEQLTTPEGEFIGGILDPHRLFAEIDGINRLLLDCVLPRVRELGWYGIGGFDVLIDRDGKFFIEDPNFRMTGMTPYLCQARNGIIRKSMVSFIATFRGSEEEFRKTIMPLAHESDPHQMIHFIALTHHGDTYRMNAAMYFEQEMEVSIQHNAKRLSALGLESKALRKLSENGRRKYPDFPEA